MRRFLIILAIVIVLLGVGVVLYFYFFPGTPGVAVAPTGSSNLPVAGNTPTDTTPTTTTDSPTTPVTSTGGLTQINAGPVVPGEVIVDRRAINASSSADVAVSYIERESGNVFSYLENAKTNTRTSNKTIPGIQSAAWLPDGSVAFVRYLSGTDFTTVNTYALAANGSGGFFLPQNLSDVAVASTSVLTLVSGVNGSMASLAHTDGTHTATVFTTPLSSLHISFAGKGKYLVSTKASGALAGDAFVVDSTGHFSRVAGPLSGLVALASPSGKWVLVSYTLASGLQMELVNTATGEILPLPVATIAEKCVWTTDDSSVYCGIPVNPATNATYPDDWYQGAVSFSDRIWKINVSGRYAQLVFDFSKETSGSLDMESPAIDALGTTLVFINKNDGSLWSYSL